MARYINAATGNTVNLAQFSAAAMEDSVKRNLELTCDACGEILCDVESGDTLNLLVSMAFDHVCADDE